MAAAGDVDSVKDAPSTSSGAGAGGVADPWAAFWVPGKVLEQSADVIDIATPDSQRCRCFTECYTQYTKVGARAVHQGRGMGSAPG